MFEVNEAIIELKNNAGETMFLKQGAIYTLYDECGNEVENVSFFEFDKGRLTFFNGDFAVVIVRTKLKKIRDEETKQELYSFVEGERSK